MGGAPPSVLPDISPTRGEIDLRQPLGYLERLRKKYWVSAQPISLLVGEMPGRAEGGKPHPISSPSDQKIFEN